MNAPLTIGSLLEAPDIDRSIRRQQHARKELAYAQAEGVEIQSLKSWVWPSLPKTYCLRERFGATCLLKFGHEGVCRWTDNSDVFVMWFRERL